MNRVETYLAEKRAAERQGLSAEESRQLDQIENLTKQIHAELFPEEYDFMMDSIADAGDRRRGKNPMSSDYTEKVNARRTTFGVPPLGPNGLPTDNSSWEVARTEAIRRAG